MDPVLVLLIALSVVLLALWVLMMAMIFSSLGPSLGADDEWRRMLMGSFRGKAARDFDVWGWWLSTTLSTVGWLMAFVSVWNDLAEHPYDGSVRATQVRTYTVWCIVHIAVLIAWTCTIFLVGPTPREWYQRALANAQLFVAAVFYLVGAAWWVSQMHVLGLGWAVFWLTGVFLFVHALHGFYWDFHRWGREYLYLNGPYAAI